MIQRDYSFAQKSVYCTLFDEKLRQNRDFQTTADDDEEEVDADEHTEITKISRTHFCFELTAGWSGLAPTHTPPRRTRRKSK